MLASAANVANEILDKKIFQITSGHKFLEASPVQANKRVCVSYLLDRHPGEDAVLLYMGDDDKDEEAFALIQSKGGFAIRVCSNVINNPIEDWRLDNPEEARAWLHTIIKYFS